MVADADHVDRHISGPIALGHGSHVQAGVIMTVTQQDNAANAVTPVLKNLHKGIPQSGLPLLRHRIPCSGSQRKYISCKRHGLHPPVPAKATQPTPLLG